MVCGWWADGGRMVGGWWADGGRMVCGWCADGVRNLAAPAYAFGEYGCWMRVGWMRVVCFFGLGNFALWPPPPNTRPPSSGSLSFLYVLISGYR
jgi:hypothetical protein